MEIKKIKLSLIDAESAIRFFFYTGMVIAFLGSISPWFMWPLSDKYPILSSACFLFSMGMENVLKKRNNEQGTVYRNYYDRYDFILPVLLYILLINYQTLLNNKNVFGYAVNIFYVITVFAIFRVRIEELKRFCDFMAKALGAFLIVSMFFFLLYLMGFPLPGFNTEHADGMYSFTNYYFFLTDDRNLFVIIPRFQSIFVEPGHLGTLAVMLLFTQIGKWKKWYNVSLLVATFISFSLAAYGLLVPIIFLGLWIRGIKFFRKALLAVIILASISVGSFYYNGGDNLFHDLIMLRLEVDDGKLSGDNRVTDDFQADFDNLLQSSDIFFGRERDKEQFGNTGFRVFIYDNGLVGLFILIVFYILVMYQPRHKKVFISVLIIATLNFIIRANIMQFYIFIPLYQIARNAFCDVPPPDDETIALKQS